MNGNQGGKRSGQANMFTDLVERTKYDGDMFASFFRRGAGYSGLGLAGYALRAMVILVGAGMLFLVFGPLSKRDSEERSDLPGKTAVAPAPAPAPAPASVESEPPVSGTPTAEPAEDFSNYVFRAPLPAFKQVQTLDWEILGEVWDDNVIHFTPWEATEIRTGGDLRAIDHIFCFLRSHSEQELAAMAKPGVFHYDLMTRQDELHGTVLRKRFRLLRKYHIIRWEKDDGGPLDSGIRDTTMLFCANASSGENPYIYVVLTAEPPERYRERELYEMTGVFVKRFPYQRKDKDWEKHPLLATMFMTEATVTREESSTVFIAVAVGTIVVMIVLFFVVRGETKGGQARRLERLERRRRSRVALKPPPPAGSAGGSGSNDASRPPGSDPGEGG